MATKMKGIFKGIKYIQQIFVYKDHEAREMEIGYPTDVRHVAHIGLDGSSMNNPAWMTELKTAPEFSSTSLANLEQGKSASWACDDFQPAVELLQQGPDMENSPKTSRRKKSKCASAAKSFRPPTQSNPH